MIHTVDILADHGNDWLAPHKRMDNSSIRAKYRAARAPAARRPASPETLARLRRTSERAKAQEMAAKVPVDILADHGNDWLAPHKRFDNSAIRAKHRARHLAAHDPVARTPASEKTLAKLRRTSARTKKVEKLRHVQVWNQAIAVIDRSEVTIRDLIERELAGIAGIPGIRYGQAMKAADRVSAKVAAIRKRAIQRAFRLIRDKGGVK